jgi:serine/threonine-protein kinase RsbT
MMLNRKSRIRISSDADVARAVVEASRIARRYEFSESDANKLATAVSELARNIIKYAGSGEVLIGAVTHSGRDGIEVLVRDRGPGIQDLKKALEDHYSSGGTLGLGLPRYRHRARERDDRHCPNVGEG